MPPNMDPVQIAPNLQVIPGGALGKDQQVSSTIHMCRPLGPQMMSLVVLSYALKVRVFKHGAQFLINLGGGVD